jgi:uncharacterized membrane protein YgaE (UPF0421/DUF939 family)
MGSDVNWRTFLPGLQLAIRASTAAGLAFGIAQLFQLQYPLYAFIAAVIVTDLAPSQSRHLGLRRVVATIVGATCGAMLSGVFPYAAWSLAVSIFIAMLVCQLLGAQDGARVAGYICGLVVLDHSSEPWVYAYYRLIETMLGVAVAWAVSHVPKLIRLEEPTKQDT